MRVYLSPVNRTLAVVSLMILLISCSSKPESNPFDEGMALEQSGKYSEAIEKYAEALNQNPRNPKIHLRMALSLSAMGELDPAGHHYRESLELDPNNLEAHLNFSGYHYKRKDFDAALLELAQIIKLDPESEEAKIARDLTVRVEKANIRHDLISEMEDERDTTSPDDELLRKLGMAYIDEGADLFMQNRPEEAIAEYQKAIDLMPENGEFHNLLAQLYDRMGENDKALKELESANELDPKNLEYILSLAGFYTQMEKIEEGKKLLQKVIALEPKSEEARFAQRRLEELELKEKSDKKKGNEEKGNEEEKKAIKK